MGATRDFSPAMRYNMSKELNSIIQNPTWLRGDQYTSGCTARLKLFFLSAGLLAAAVDNYDNSIKERDTAAKAGLTKVFNDCIAADTKHGACVGEITSLLKEYTRFLNGHAMAMGSVRTTPNSIFTTHTLRGCGCVLTTTNAEKFANADLWITFNQICFQEPFASMFAAENSKDRAGLRDDMWTVMLYERNHPEHVTEFNRFLDELELRDQIGIKSVVYTAAEPYRQIFLENVHGAKIICATGTYDSSGAYTTCGAFCLGNDITIDFNRAEGYDPRNDPRGKYSTVFHEFGHYLDNAYGNNGQARTFTYTDRNGNTMEQLIGDSVRSHVEQETENYMNSHNYTLAAGYTQDELDTFKEAVTNQLVNGNVPGYTATNISGTSFSSGDVTNVAIDVQRTFRTGLNGADASGTSDMYDGVTNYYRDDPSDPHYSTTSGRGVSGGYQHDDDYWYNASGARIGGRGPASEGFATYFSDRMNNDTPALQITEDYIGSDVTDMFDDLLVYMDAQNP